MSALEKALNQSRKLDIDECEAVKIQKKITTVRITDSEIAEIKQNFDENYGIRLVNQKKISSFQVTDENKIGGLMISSLKQCGNLKPREFWKGLPYKKPNKNYEKNF